MTASAPLNEDLTRTLKRLGFPEVQDATKPSALLQKASTALTKRLAKLDEISKQLAPLAKKEKSDKTDERGQEPCSLAGKT